MKKVIFIFCCISVILLNATAQNKQPNIGYMGHRVMINAELVMTPSFKLVPNFNGNKTYWAFNYMLTPGIEVIVHKKGTIGAQFNYFQTQFEAKNSVFFKDDEFEMYEDGYKKPNYDMQVLGVGLYYKIYLGREAAVPFGRYLSIHADYMHYTHDTITDYINLSTGGNSVGLKVEYGRDFLFFDRLKINLGAGIGYAFTIPQIDGESPKYGLTATNGAKSRILINYIFGVKIGIGILAF